MTTNYIPLDKNKHSALKVNLKHDFVFAKDTHLAAATIREFAQIASCMPIAFVKEPSTGSVHTIAMFGFDAQQNLFFKDGKWVGHSVPLSLQRFPFDVRPDGDKLGVYIDENSEYVGETGEALFTEDGEPTEFLKNRHQLLGDIANSEMATQQFIKKLQELELLEDIQLTVFYADGKRRNVTGLMSISERKLNSLDDEKILDLKNTGFLGAIYAVLLSLGQINRLVQLSADTDTPIRNVQMSPVQQEETADAAH